MEPITIEIRFGDTDDPELSDTEVFTFATRAEADAFMTGIYAMDGWDSATVLQDTRHPEVPRGEA